MTRYPKPWRIVDEGEEVVDATDRHVCFADSVEAAAEIVSLANSAHRAVEANRLYVERLNLIRKESAL